MKTVIYILLIVSLAFNVFFAVGYFQAGKQQDKARTVEGRARIMAEKLNLDPQQYEVFETLLAEFSRTRKAKMAQREALIAELIKNQPDEKILEDLTIGDSARQNSLDRVAMMRKFIGILRPQQREMFLEIIQSRNSSSQASPPPGN